MSIHSWKRIQIYPEISFPSIHRFGPNIVGQISLVFKHCMGIMSAAASPDALEDTVGSVQRF